MDTEGKLKVPSGKTETPHHSGHRATQRKYHVIHCVGFQRSTGFLAAAVSSSRETRVVCGASSTVCGSSSTSCAIDFMASTKRSISSLDSLSVGSIIKAPGTINGNAVVYGWNP